MINYIHKKIRKQAFSISALKLNKIFSIHWNPVFSFIILNAPNHNFRLLLILSKNDESRLQKENDMRYLWAFFFVCVCVCVCLCTVLACLYTCEARWARSTCVQSTPIDITRILLNRLTVSHATENSWSKMADHACGTLSYFHYRKKLESWPKLQPMVKSLHNVNSIQIHLNVPPYFLSFSVYRKTFNKQYSRACFHGEVYKLKS